MDSNKARQKRRKVPVLAAIVIGILILLAILLGNCLGLGKGKDKDKAPLTPPPQPLVSPTGAGDAGPASNADARRQIPTCELFLAKEGLKLNGQLSTIDDAVRACQKSNRAMLRVTGDAITGTYKELVQKFKQAGIKVTEEKW